MELTPKESEVLGLLEQLTESYHELERMEESADVQEMFDVRLHLRLLRRTIIHRAAIRSYRHLTRQNHAERKPDNQSDPSGTETKTVFGERTL